MTSSGWRLQSASRCGRDLIRDPHGAHSEQHPANTTQRRLPGPSVPYDGGPGPSGMKRPSSESTNRSSPSWRRRLHSAAIGCLAGPGWCGEGWPVSALGKAQGPTRVQPGPGQPSGAAAAALLQNTACRFGADGAWIYDVHVCRQVHPELTYRVPGLAGEWVLRRRKPHPVRPCASVMRRRGRRPCTGTARSCRGDARCPRCHPNRQPRTDETVAQPQIRQMQHI